MPDYSHRINTLFQLYLNNKITNLVEYITGADVSCLMHIEGILKRNKSDIKKNHIAGILNNNYS